MTKRKRNILLITLGIIIITLTAAVGIAYAAYNVVIDYNYNFTAHADMLSINVDTNRRSVSVTKAGSTALTATKSDIVLISEDSAGDITLGGRAASKYVIFKIGEIPYRKSVFTDMPLSASPTTSFTASADVTGLKAAISEAVYDNDKTVKYDNIFVGSQLDFELMNFHSQYNNISELWNNYQNKQISSRTAYLLTDIYITADYTVNIPCSIDLLTSKITVGKDIADNIYSAGLQISHSYPGAYYISAITEDDNITVATVKLSGSIIIGGNSGKITVNAPKAYYQVAGSLTGSVTVTDYSGDYTPLLVDDALDFASGQLPDRFHSTLTLRQNYQTYGIKYSYYKIDAEGGAQGEEFNGRVVPPDPYSSDSARLNALTRGLNTTEYWIRIYATPKSGVPGSIDKKVSVIGSGESAMLQDIFYNIAGSYYNPSYSSDNKLRLDIDLLSIIKYEYESGGFSGDITVSVFESEFRQYDLTTDAGKALEKAALNSSAAVRLVLSDGSAVSAARKFTVGLNSAGRLSRKDDTGVYGNELKYFVISKSITTLSDKLTIKLSSTLVPETTAATRDYDLAVSTRQEVMYYLKSLLTSFTTNKIYSAIHIPIAKDGIYSGTEKLISSVLGLEDIKNKLVFRRPDENNPGSYLEDDELDATEIAERFDYNADSQTYKAKSAKINVKDVYLRYTFVFADNAEQIIYLPVVKSLSDDGGENQEFESSNPFDELFMSSETAWANGGEFTVPEDKTWHFAYIGIVSVNGQNYNAIPENQQKPLHKMVRIVDKTLNTDVGEKYDETFHTESELDAGTPPLFSGVDGDNTVYYKTIRFVTNRDYVPDYNVSVRVRCWYLNSATPDIVLIQDYVIVIPGIFKCYDITAGDPNPPLDATPYVFTDRNFYDLTMDLFFENHPDLYASYVSEFLVWDGDGAIERVLLSDSAYATVNLDYSGLVSPGAGVNVEGIQRLKNVILIRLDNIEVSNTRAFSEMSDSALEYLYLKNCKMTDSALYGTGASQSYLYNLHLKEADLSGNSLTRTDKLLSRTVTWLDMSNQNSGCLTDIAGLYNLTGLQTLDVSGNAILRFEVLRTLSTLKDVYIYGNISYIGDANGELYGTDGRINIPHYVSSIKNFGTKIHANSSDTADYIIIDRTPTGNFVKFSLGGDISADQEEGSIVLNAFATPVMIYSKKAVWMLMSELYNHKVTSSELGIWKGETGTDGYYKYMFYNPYAGTLSQIQIAFLNKDGSTVVTVGTVNNPWSTEGDITFLPGSIPAGTYSYMISVLDQSGKVIGYREFLVEIVALS